MGATHLPSIVITISLAAVPAQAQGFSNVLLLVPLATNSLNGNRFVEYTSYSDAVSDNTAGYISSSTLSAVQVAFSQRPAPAKFVVGYVDIVGGETYADGVQEVLDAGGDFYGVCMESRADADILSLSADIEARQKLCCIVSGDVTWLTAGFPAGLTALDGRENTFGCYQDDTVANGAWPDVAELVNRLAYNPDSVSVPWNTPLQAVTPLVTAITSAQRSLLLANKMNVVLPFQSSTANYFYQGLNFAGRQIHEIVSSHWFHIRLQEGASNLIAKLSSLGDKLSLNTDGQSRVITMVEGIFTTGVSAGHFAEGETEINGETITGADRSSFKLRFTGRAQLLGSATDLDFNLSFSNEPLA